MEIEDDDVPDVSGRFSGYDDPIAGSSMDLSGFNNSSPHPYDLTGQTNNMVKQSLIDATRHNSEAELEGLSEILPDVKSRRSAGRDHAGLPGGMTADNVAMPSDDNNSNNIHNPTSPTPILSMDEDSTHAFDNQSNDFRRGGVGGGVARRSTNLMYDTPSSDEQEILPPAGTQQGVARRPQDNSNNNDSGHDESTTLDGYPDESGALDDSNDSMGNDRPVPKEFINPMSSIQSISTATQTHEVHMPMYLPTFKPATGCTNASDFIVRCFVARLRSGITVVKHGRSRWCKSRLRVLHIHSDGRSLSWKPAEGEPNTNKRPPKLDLSTCLEVRHAWSPDPQNPMYTGTPILRQKCEAANAHKSFALIFKHRTVDITAVTADQCKVLMEGFSALCFRLQVANLASRGSAKNKPPHARPMPEEDGISTTASATLTNSSTPRGR